MSDITQKTDKTPQDISNTSQSDDDNRARSAERTRGSQSQSPQAIPMKPGFYLVATPIGNLRDITFRALDVLSSVDLIICEDTRVTGKLMSAYGFKKKMQVYNDHSTDEQREYFTNMVQEGQAIAVLSDAGTPLVSDPGYKLVRMAIEKELYVTSLPGANAALSALQLSGLATDQFSFLGFLPSKTVARQKALQEWREASGTLIFYETGPRLIESLQDMLEILGDRDAAVMRELTKMYEEAKRGKLSELIAHYHARGEAEGRDCCDFG